MSVEQSTLTELTPTQIAELEGMLTSFVTKADGGAGGNLPIVFDMAVARHGSHTSEASAAGEKPAAN